MAKRSSVGSQQLDKKQIGMIVGLFAVLLIVLYVMVFSKGGDEPPADLGAVPEVEATLPGGSDPSPEPTPEPTGTPDETDDEISGPSGGGGVRDPFEVPSAAGAATGTTPIGRPGGGGAAPAPESSPTPEASPSP